MTLDSGTRLGRYVVGSLIGSGGMGEVYLAEDPALARRVALKVLHRDRQDEDLLRRFEQEALAASALNHPHILTIYEFGSEGGVRFLACEHVEGVSLRQRLRDAGGPLPLAEVLRIGQQTAAALAAAHQAGIVHRDIKPENLMLRPDGYVKVLDFGLAKRSAHLGPLADAHTVLTSMPGMILGTVVYMSPEQARGMPVDARADVWSLGCVLYEMVTGRAPFDGHSPVEVLAAVLNQQPHPVASERPECPVRLAALIESMLLKEREARPASMGLVAEELRSIARDLEIPAERPAAPASPASRTGAAPGRVPRAWLLAVGLALVAIVVLAIVRSRPDTFQDTTRAIAPPQTAPAASPGAAERSLDFWLVGERVSSDGEATEETMAPGQRLLAGGMRRFQLHVTTSAAGHLYVVNEFPGQSERTLALVHPGVGAVSAIAAQAPFQKRLAFSGPAGTEHLWLVYSSSPVNALEALAALVNPRDRGVVTDPARVGDLERLLAEYRVSGDDVRVDSGRRRTTLTGTRPVLTYLVELERN